MRRIHTIPAAAGLILLCLPVLAPGQFFEKEIDYQSLFKKSLTRNGRVLNLAGKKIGDAGLRLLASNPLLKKVGKLDLRYNEITAEGARYLAESEYLGRLQSLELRHNDLTDSGAERLAQTGRIPALKTLGLGWNQIHDPGGMAVAGSQTLPKTLKKLDLRGNFLADSTKEALKKTYSHLKKLQLY